MEERHLGRKTVSLDYDTIYWTDVLQQVRDMPEGHGGCFYFEDTGDKPIFSYIKADEQGGHELITDIAEKRAISNKVNTGAYVFSSARLLRQWAAINLDQQSEPGLSEYFTSQMIKMMLIEGKLPFLGIQIDFDDFSCVGTPEQLQDLPGKLKSHGSDKGAENGTVSGAGASLGRVVKRKRRFCFDLDMTLVGVPKVPGDYSTCPLIERNI